MPLVVGDGRLLPKFIPSFAWYLQGKFSATLSGKQRLYETARRAMARRNCAWTATDEALWDEVFRLTAAQRDDALARAENGQSQ